MGSRRAAIQPSWTVTIGAWHDSGHLCRLSCAICGVYRDIDLTALIEAKGRDYSLWNRRPPCRLSERCAGRMTILYGGKGVLRPARDPD